MVTLDDIRTAQQRLKGVAFHTPLIPYVKTSGGNVSPPQPQLWLKAENFQPIGAFKLRGAYNKLVALTPEERRRGVITYSSGNHAQGVAFAARALDVKSVIVMPRNAPSTKIEATRGYGAQIEFVGPSSSERQARAEELASKHGYVIIPPYNDEHIIAGQGTVGLEILTDLPEAGAVLVPIGGGGLISGTATAVKLINPAVKVIGVEPELAADAQASMREGRIVEWSGEQTARTMADGLRTQHVGEITFAHMRRYVDQVLTVSEDEISAATALLAVHAKLVAEPSGAVSFAAWHFHQDELPQVKCTVAVISGGNIEPQLLADILHSYHEH